MHGPKFEIPVNFPAGKNLANVALVSILALILNLQIWQSAAANGSIAYPTPRPWGKFVPIKLSRQTLHRGKAACIYMRQHHGLKHHAAAAIIGHLIQESKVQATGIRGDRGTAFGIAQWRGIRFKALKRFAAKSGRTWKDLHAQLDFIAHELRTSEKFAGRALKAAATLEDAAIAFMRYERPQGYTHANPRGGMAWSKRLSNGAYLANNGYCMQEQRAVAAIQAPGHR
ncbi:MAG: phage tail tip lysozyme [Rhizobiaceae bacterium]